MSFAIYDLDEDVRSLLQLDNFLNGRTTTEFVEQLSKDHIQKGAEFNNLEYLDPKPYIRTFESTLRHLKQLGEEAQRQKEVAAKEVEEYELQHSRNVLKLSSQVESVVSNFDRLDREISSITKKIDPLNQALNKITNLRERSIEAIFLIRAYHGFYTKEKYEPLEKLRVAKLMDQRMKCATTVRNLIKLARKIAALTGNIPKVDKCVVTIEKYGETMETALIDLFEISSESEHYEEMGRIAKLLFEFNGGSSVVLAFLNKSDLFLDDDADTDGVSSILDKEDAWKALDDPAAQVHDIFKDEATEHRLNALKVSIKFQARIMQSVFENPTPVFKLMIQRIYAQMILNKVSTLLQYSQQAGALAHVRVLHALYILVGEFTADIKDFFATNEFDPNNDIGSALDQCFADLFIDTLLDHSYFALEKDVLEHAIFAIAHPFNSANERALARRELESKLLEIDNAHAALDMAAIGLRSEPSARPSFKFVDSRRVRKFKEFMKTRLDLLRDRDAQTRDLDALSAAQTHTVLKLAIETTARVLELLPQKAAKFSLEILEILVFDFGGLYVACGLEVAYDKAVQEKAAAAQTQGPSLEYLRVFNVTSEILHLLSLCIKSILLPCTANNPPVRSRMISLANTFVQRCETSLNLVLECVMGLVSDRIGHLLTTQKKKDFICDTIDSNRDYTETCAAISDFLIHTQGVYAQHLSNNNYSNALIKIGMITLNLLLDHFKKFSVNTTGGIVLTQDVIRYQSVIDSWEIQALSEKFQLLREISNLFTVQPNLINSLTVEGHLAGLKISTVRQYISRRTDFSPSYMERFFGRK
ncbi:hypothetical protein METBISCDRAFT_23385 [Metschnikowia bicuspidata]|uniref:Uncharacterized protein n=1 Tax=Metschnikowia bicuspidata TaxID=27322 RepID=A0A4P9ZCF9_9ASCO|nr:hypothetical protein METBISCDRAFT_23385 [Metschnikowia bicuspidata]